MDRKGRSLGRTFYRGNIIGPFGSKPASFRIERSYEHNCLLPKVCGDRENAYFRASLAKNTGREHRLTYMSNKITSQDKPKGTEQDVDLGEVYTRTELFLEKNKQAILIGVVALLAIVGGALLYKTFVAGPKAKEASELVWKAEYYFEIDSLDRALNGDTEWPGFVSIADQYSSTPTGNLANYYLGAIYMKKGDYDLAIDHYKKADLDDDVLRVMAVGNIGDALVELDRTDEAVKEFEKAASMVRNEFTTPMYLMKAGILHQQSGNWAGAAKAFNRVAAEFPNSPDANQAKKYAGRAEAMGG